MFAATTDTGYRIILLIHIASVVLAFGPNFVGPILRRNGATDVGMAKTTRAVQLPSIAITFLSGILLIVLSGEVFSFEKPWVSTAFLVTIAAGVVMFLLAAAYEKADKAAEKMIGMYSGILHLLLVVALVMMIWKPGQ